MHFNIILKNFFEGGGGAQNLTLPPGASYPRYATGRCRGPGSISSGLTLTLREDWACKRALETLCHARIATSPRGPTAMSPDR